MRQVTRYFLIVVILPWSLTLFAQPLASEPRYIDSILPLLNKMPEDTVKVKQLEILSVMYIEINPDSAILFGMQGDSISEKLYYYEGQIRCLTNTAFAHIMHGNWAEATIVMNKAIPLCQEYHPEYLLLSYCAMFAITAIKGDMDGAGIWKDRQQLAMQNNSHFPEFYKWPSFMQGAIYYQRKNKIDSAQIFADSMMVYLEKYGRGETGLRRDSYMVLGIISLKRNNMEQAIYYFRKGPYLFGLAEVHQKLGNRDSAIFFAKQDLAKWEKLKSPHNIMLTAKLLGSLYSDIDPVESNKYLGKYIEASDSLYSQDKLKQFEQVKLSEQQLNYELQKRDADTRNKISLIVFSGIIILLSGFALLLWRNNRFKHKANQQLEASYKALKDAQAQLIQSEKMASLGELTAGIAHEIQNPLNFVNNFSEVNSELIFEMKNEIKTGNLEEIRIIADDLDANMEKITFHGKRADAIVKSMLQHSRQSSGQKEPTDINALADEYFRLSYHGIRAKDQSFNAALHTAFDESIGEINIIPQDIARVLLNIYNNAFHAVAERKRNHPDGYNPEVTVSTRKKGDLLEISISDNGTGIPENLLSKIFQPFFTTRPAGEGTGLGLSLSYDIVKAHGGSLRVETKENEYTRFILDLPIL